MQATTGAFLMLCLGWATKLRRSFTRTADPKCFLQANVRASYPQSKSSMHCLFLFSNHVIITQTGSLPCRPFMPRLTTSSRLQGDRGMILRLSGVPRQCVRKNTEVCAQGLVCLAVRIHTKLHSPMCHHSRDRMRIHFLHGGLNNQRRVSQFRIIARIAVASFQEGVGSRIDWLQQGLWI